MGRQLGKKILLETLLPFTVANNENWKDRKKFVLRLSSFNKTA